MPSTLINTVGTVYDLEFHTAMTERITQNIALLNAGSRGTIIAVPGRHRGDYKKNTFWAAQQLIKRRDDTDNSAQTPEGPSNLEQVSVKVKRMALMEVSHDSLVNVDSDPAAASRIFGERVAEQKLQDMLNTGLLSLRTAVASVAGLNLDVSAGADAFVTPSRLNSTLALMGDAAQRVRAWVMHSKADFDVRGGLLSTSVSGIQDLVTIQGGIPAYLGRPALVTDSAALTTAGPLYHTLGLTEGALVLEESDPEVMAYELVTGRSNLVHRFQTEYSFTITVKGFTWGPASAQRNPTDAQLSTAGAWDKVATSNKDCAAVRLLSD
jgi:hypothetical protein